MSKMTAERKEYLKNYQKNELKRVPLDMSHEMYIEVSQHALYYGKKRGVNGYIKKSLRLIMDIESLGIKDEVVEMVERAKTLRKLSSE